MNNGTISQRSQPYLLWLDDEPEHLTCSVIALQERGFDVIVASNTGEALYYVEHHDFDAIISDLHMPPPDGISFLKQAFRLQPHAVYIIASAYLYNNVFRDSLKDLYESKVCVCAIEKPFSIDELIRVLLDSLIQLVPKIPEERKTMWRRFLEAFEIKPGAFGVSLDLKRLLGLTQRK
jgi:CheY-like chemotaxis protein